MDTSSKPQSTVFAGMSLSPNQASDQETHHMHACSIWTMWLHVQQRWSMQEAAVLPANHIHQSNTACSCIQYKCVFSYGQAHKPMEGQPNMRAGCFGHSLVLCMFLEGFGCEGI